MMTDGRAEWPIQRNASLRNYVENIRDAYKPPQSLRFELLATEPFELDLLKLFKLILSQLNPKLLGEKMKKERGLRLYCPALRAD
jgi:hypothetical protein